MKKSLIHLPAWSLPQALGRRQQHWTKAGASLASAVMGMGQEDPHGEWYGSNSSRGLGVRRESELMGKPVLRELPLLGGHLSHRPWQCKRGHH